MKCPNCNRPGETASLCNGCKRRLTNCLKELPWQVLEARNHLTPARGGHGTNSGERTLGINITALDWTTGKPVTDILWEWEALIRDERGLVKPALLEPAPDEVGATVAFHLAHLNWTAEQPWVADYFHEIANLHKQGQIASRTQNDPVRRIACPSPHPTEADRYCNQMLAVESTDMLEALLCKRCQTNWTPARLVAVAMSDPNRIAWLDVESVANWVGISERQCRRVVKTYEIERKGSLLNFTQFVSVFRTNSI